MLKCRAISSSNMKRGDQVTCLEGRVLADTEGMRDIARDGLLAEHVVRALHDGDLFHSLEGVLPARGELGHDGHAGEGTAAQHLPLDQRQRQQLRVLRHLEDLPHARERDMGGERPRFGQIQNSSSEIAHFCCSLDFFSQAAEKQKYRCIIIKKYVPGWRPRAARGSP